MADSWSVRNLYFYLVCLVTLFLFVGGFITAATSAVEIALPDKPNVPLIHLYYPEFRDGIENPDFSPPSLDELEKMREEQERAETYYSAWARRRLLNAIALMIIPLPFYLYHWRKINPVTR